MLPAQMSLLQLKSVQYGPRNLPFKIGPVTAEIFLIWTDVARTNVAWTNITATVGISER